MPTRRYEIRIAGRLSSRARGAFVDMDVHAVAPETIIADTVHDDADLHRLLGLIQSVGLGIVSIHQVPLEAPARIPDGDADRRSTCRSSQRGEVSGAATGDAARTDDRGVAHHVDSLGGLGFPKRSGDDMAIGPVQLVVLGFQNPDFHGEIIEELERLRASDTVRVIDALAVYKDADGEFEATHLSNLSDEEAVEFGSVVGALVGLGFDGEEGAAAGAQAGAEAAADGISAFSDADAWDILEEIPNNSAAALLLLEHHWAVGLRDAIVRAGGYRVSDGFISPLDLIGVGLLTAEEAAALHDVERTTAPV